MINFTIFEKEIENTTLLASIKDIIINVNEVACKSTNTILLNMYWEIRRLIVEDEQGDKAKAGYGNAVLMNVSQQLALQFGKGFDESNLRNIRQFYLAFQKVTQCVTF